VLSAEQDSTNFYTKAEKIESAAAQDSTYEVDEHIFSQRPTRQRRFPTKYQDCVVKKVRVITSSAKKPNYQSNSERTSESDSTALKSSERRKECDIDEVSAYPNNEDTRVKRTKENTSFGSDRRKADQSQRSIGTPLNQYSQSAVSIGDSSASGRRQFAIIDQTACLGATPSTSASTTSQQLFCVSMPKVKFTARKMKTEREPSTPKAAKEFKCIECNKTFTQKSNYLRHLGLVHEVDEFRNILPVAERLKLQR